MSTLPIYKKVGLIASIVATIILLPYMTTIVSKVSGTGKSHMELGFMAGVGLVLALVSLFTGGIIQAFRMAFSAGKAAWVIVPVPLTDILVGAIVGYLIFMVLVCVPVIPMISSCRRYSAMAI